MLERWKKLSKALYFKAIRYFSQFGLIYNLNKQIRGVPLTVLRSGGGTDQIEQILPGRAACLDKAYAMSSTAVIGCDSPMPQIGAHRGRKIFPRRKKTTGGESCLQRRTGWAYLRVNFKVLAEAGKAASAGRAYFHFSVATSP